MLIGDLLTNNALKLKPAYRAYKRLTRGRRNQNRFVGVFHTFDEARGSIPAHSAVGYDDAELAGWYRERLDQVFPEDYPVLFWLQRLMPDVRSVFDFGGHVGLHFHGWQRLMAWPRTLRWQVCEVPAVVEAGRRLAKERSVDQLSFTARPEDASGFDVFLACGSLQYLEPGFLHRLLNGLAQRPKHLLLNKVPVHPSVDYVTIQDAHSTFHPYAIVSRPSLISSLAELGYRLVDEWQSHEHDCHVLGHAELDVAAYTGAYFIAD